MKFEINKHFRKLILLISCLSIICVCDSCRHRSSHRNTHERHAQRRDRERRNNDSEISKTQDLDSDYISNLAEGDDYDAMLKCVDNGIRELKKVKKEYFAGKLTDKEAQEKVERITQKYDPVINRLKEADAAGELNYNQHKKQIKQATELINMLVDIFNKFGIDVEKFL